MRSGPICRRTVGSRLLRRCVPEGLGPNGYKQSVRTTMWRAGPRDGSRSRAHMCTSIRTNKKTARIVAISVCLQACSCSGCFHESNVRPCCAAIMLSGSSAWRVFKHVPVSNVLVHVFACFSRFVAVLVGDELHAQACVFSNPSQRCPLGACKVAVAAETLYLWMPPPARLGASRSKPSVCLGHMLVCGLGVSTRL